MEMSMFVLPILGSDFSRAEIKNASNAGWGRSELAWESLQQKGNDAFCNGDYSAALRLFKKANWIARIFFSQTDLRRATSKANLAIAEARKNATQPNTKLLQQAASLWALNANSVVESMSIAPRSRSSLFHMRMEVLHRDTYHDNLRKRIGKIADETRQSLEAIGKEAPFPHRHYSRWKGERPPVFDDTRRVLGACLLLIDA